MIQTLRISYSTRVNTAISLIGTYSSVNKTTGYVENHFDMSAYKGKTIWLYFQGTKPDKPFMLLIDDDLFLSQPLDKSLLFYLDDVTLTVTQ